jgi:hypothetical protein
VTVDVAPLSAEHEAPYARFVAAHPDALISYTLGYRDLLVETLGCRPRYAVALRDAAVVGVMPMMSVEGGPGSVLNSLPYFGSNGGPLAADATACDALCAWYAEQTRGDGVVAATVVANPLVADVADVVHDIVDSRIAHVTALRRDGDGGADVLAAIDGAARRNVAKAQRLGTTVAVENDAFGELQSLHRQSMAAIGAPVKAAQFFDAVPRSFRPLADFDVYVARTDGEAVAALLVFYCAQTVDYYVPAVSPRHRAEQPMAAILARAMSDAARRGFTRWNWGGSLPSHHSLQRFKAKWGGVPTEYLYKTKLNDASLLHARREEILAAYPGFFVVPFSCLDAA